MNASNLEIGKRYVYTDMVSPLETIDGVYVGRRVNAVPPGFTYEFSPDGLPSFWLSSTDDVEEA